MKTLEETVQAVADLMKIDAEQARRRKAFLELGDRDVELLRDLHERLRSVGLDFVEGFYDHLLAFEETRKFLADPSTLGRLKRAQAAYFERLTSGLYDWDYVADRLRVGVAHQRVGLDPQWYLGAYRKYLCWLLPTIWRLYRHEPERALEAYQALVKVVFFDVSLAIDTYIHADRRALLATRAYSEKVVASVPSGLLVLRGDLRVFLANRSFGEMCGVRAAELVGRPVAEVLPVAGLREHALEVMATGETRYALPFELRTEGAEPRPLRITFAGIRLAEEEEEEEDLLVVEDLSAEERLRAQARASEMRFREVVEHATDGIVMLGEDGLISYFNGAAERMFGYGRDETLGRPVTMLMPEQYRQAREAGTRRFLATGRSAMLGKVRQVAGQRKDGTVFPLEYSISACRLDGHTVLTGVLRDITERKQLTARMMQMDRMIAVGTLAAGVGHEINNPLTYVTANLSFALDRLDRVQGFLAAMAGELRRRFGDECLDQVLAAAGGARADTDLGDIREALDEGRRGSERIRDIVRDLRTFSRSDDEKRVTLDVHKVIGSAIDMAFNEIRHRARLVKEFGRVPHVHGNEGKLGQVLLNLLVNAAHAIDEGAAENNEIRIHTLERDGQVAIEVRDTGKGISAEELPRIFDPFFTTKPIGQGTGLGLAICRHIVDGHGGRIEVESKPGRGSVFRVLLPAAPPSAEAPAPAPSETPAPTRRGRILVVDDEPLIGRIMVRALGEEHEVVPTTTAREALERLDSGEHFDLVFCDLMMPEMTGMDLYDRLVERSSPVAGRMIFLTGGAFTPRAREFLDRTPNLHIEKPFDGKNLRTLVRDLLR